MGPIFNKKLLKSEVCRSRKQCMGPTNVAENCLTSQILRLLSDSLVNKLIKYHSR